MKLNLHPSVFCRYLESRHRSYRLIKVDQTSLSTATFSSASWSNLGVTTPDKIYTLFSAFWVYCRVSYQSDMPGHPLKTTYWSDSQIASVGFFQHDSTPRSLQMSELCAVVLSLSPTTLQRKLNLVTYFQDLIVFVTTQARSMKSEVFQLLFSTVNQ